MGVKLGSHETGRSVARRAGPWRVRGALAGVARAAYTPSPMRHITIGLSSGLVALALVAAPALALESVWARLPASLPADSLAPALERLEAGRPRALAAAAAYTLGQFHHARGEYRQAADAFGRAAARLAGYEKADARYRQGLAWLGVGDGGRARAAFEYVSVESQPLRPLAQLGLAQALGLAGESDHELDVLRRLLDRPAGEAEPAALELYAALCDRTHRAAAASAARDRLLRRWPRSLEAARLGTQPAPPSMPRVPSVPASVPSVRASLSSVLPARMPSVLPASLTSVLPANSTSVLPASSTSVLPASLTSVVPASSTSVLR